MSASIDSLEQIIAFVMDLSEQARLSPKDAHRLRLATDELFVNIVTHGYPANGGDPHQIELHGTPGSGHVLLQMHDWSQPFDPTTAEVEQRPAPDRIGGFGLRLAKLCADRLAYERVGNMNRTIIVVRRQGRANA
ncbi:ATP-binding protein [Nonomuraea sp. LPB2021202275-12-8]|uniref:ATP-binding protein n=1 Tax=Nonomuraea sp. LPB2021202275-12-8 TaxID=3120159 RepID=UPI00300C5350